MSYEKGITKTLELLRNHLRHNSNTTTGRITRSRDVDGGKLTVECSAGDRYVSVEYTRHRVGNKPSLVLTANKLPIGSHNYGSYAFCRYSEWKALKELRKLLKKLWPDYDVPKEPWSPGLVNPLPKLKRQVINSLRKAGHAVEGNR